MTCEGFLLFGLTGVLVNDPTGSVASFFIPDDPDKKGYSGQGGVVITENCEILGMEVSKPVLAARSVSALPLLGQINTACIIVIIPIE